MGPPPFGSGNYNDLRRDVSDNKASSISMLQWGHRLSVVETFYVPPQREREYRLQWGHRLSVVETLRKCTRLLSKLELQWGHRLSVVETIANTAAAVC